MDQDSRPVVDSQKAGRDGNSVDQTEHAGERGSSHWKQEVRVDSKYSSRCKPYPVVRK